MDWQDIHYFVIVAREQSISKASRILHISQPTLTARLKKLEAEFNVPLLERNWKGVELTPYGHHFLLYAVKVMKEFNDMNESLTERNAADIAKSEKLKLGVMRPLGPFFLAPVLHMLKKEYPHLKYDVISDSSAYLMELISVRKIHLGILPYFKPQPGLSSVLLFQEDIALLAPKNDPFRTEVAGDDWRTFLTTRPFYLYSPNMPFRKIIDYILFKLLGGLPDNIHELNDTNTLLHLVSSGLGYTILPTSYIHNVFELNQAVRKPLCPDAFIIDRSDIPYDIFYLSSFPKRTVSLVFPDDWKSSFPLRQIAEDIVSVYSSSQDMNLAGKHPFNSSLA